MKMLHSVYTVAPKRRHPGSPVPLSRLGKWILGFGFLAMLLMATGCQVLTYTSPSGEHFSRSSIGANVALSSLKVEADTNGVRHVELQGYTSDSSQTATAVTEAAVKAAIQSAK
jgi:hypothetical protein